MDAKPLQSIWKISGPSVADSRLSGIVSRRSAAGATELNTGSVRKSAPARQQPGSDFVDAFAHGLTLPECWRTTDTWLTNAELSERSGLTRQNVTRLSAVLLERGYLVRERHRGRLRLTALTMNLGVASAFARVPVRAAKPQLARLASELDVYAALSVRAGDRLQIVQNVISPYHPNAVHMDVGGQLPICRSASGLALVCALSASEASPLMQRLQLHYGVRWSSFERHLQKTRLEYLSKGYCASVCILARDVGAVAVPVVTPGSEEIFVLACGMPAREFYPERVDVVVVGVVGMTSCGNFGTRSFGLSISPASFRCVQRALAGCCSAIRMLAALAVTMAEPSSDGDNGVSVDARNLQRSFLHSRKRAMRPDTRIHSRESLFCP